MKKLLTSMIALAGVAAVANAQTYETNGAALRFEAWNGSVWSSNANINPGQRAEWRVVVDYTGTRTDLYALGEVYHQPLLGNVDNTGASGAVDSVSVGQGFNSGNVQGNMVPAGNASNGNQLSVYGRLFPFGLSAMQFSNLNQMSVFRSSGPTAADPDAPAGEFMRVAGSGASTWAKTVANTGTVTTADLQLILRGVINSQSSNALQPTAHTGNVITGVVLMRGAFVASTDVPVGGNRVVSLSTDERFLRRWGSTTVSPTDNRRYISWQTSAGDTGSGVFAHRTGVNVVGGTITIVPSPAPVALMGLGGLFAARRRRA
jgi:hypothetical protein